MKRWRKSAGHNSLFYRTLRPVLVVSLLIMGLYAVVMQLNVLDALRGNAVSAFGKQVEKRKLFVENEMNGRWSQIDGSVEAILGKIEALLKEKGVGASRVMWDEALNKEILETIMGDVIGTLQGSSASEIFLILDGNIYQQDAQGTRAGIYLRNSNPGSYSSNNGNLLLERGISSISKEWQIPLDSYWTAEFEFNSLDSAEDYFYKPIQAVSENPMGEFSEFAYWSYGYPIDKRDKGVLMYSVPLISSDGTVIGVMGVGVSEEHVRQQMDYTELGGDRSGAYFLVREDESRGVVPLVTNGTAYNSSVYYEGETFPIKDLSDSSVVPVEIGKDQGGDVFASAQKLKIYDGNSMFAGETWALVGIQKRSVLLENYQKSQRMMWIVAMTGILVCMLGLYWSSRKITVPVRRLVQELKGSDPNRPIRLPRLKVEEIDVLSSSIEELSTRVASAFTKISTIIQMSESGIGVFEYKEEEDLVFLNKGFYEMMGWGEQPGENSFMDGRDFAIRMKYAFEQPEHRDKNVVEVVGENGVKKWFRLNWSRDDGSVLGVLTDVTADILEKRQIEYQRDYDVLTGLCNRRAFEERMKQLFQEPEKLGYGVLLVWDLDNLKYVNDSYGHTIGDDYIVGFARCLMEFEAEGLASARRSGDEFVTFIFGTQQEEVLFQTVQNIWDKIQQCSLRLPNGNQYKIRVSAGKAWFPKDAEDFDTLFQYADFAMYTVKHSRKGTIEDFNRDIYQENRILLQGQEAFNKLLEQHLVRYMLQPVISVKDGSIYGYEMLMRSQLPMFRSPLDILRVAHSQSRLYELEVLTWFESMKGFTRLEAEGKLAEGSRVFINSIANQMMQQDMLELFESTYPNYLDRVVCEFTEEEQNNGQITGRKLEIMRQWGALVAIDDYGCGYNSQTVLLEVKPNIVKLDMSIVRGIDQDENRRRLVRDLVLYGKERNILVLGEGVETAAELETLISLGVDLLQGYYLARPSYEGTGPEDKAVSEVRALSRKYEVGK